MNHEMGIEDVVYVQDGFTEVKRCYNCGANITND